MQEIKNSERDQDIIRSLDYIRDLFIRNEDSLALHELDSVLEKMETMSKKMHLPQHEVFQQEIAKTIHCLETRDYVRLMDILIFEIKPLFTD